MAIIGPRPVVFINIFLLKKNNQDLYMYIVYNVAVLQMYVTVAISHVILSYHTRASVYTNDRRMCLYQRLQLASIIASYQNVCQKNNKRVFLCKRQKRAHIRFCRLFAHMNDSSLFHLIVFHPFVFFIVFIRKQFVRECYIQHVHTLESFYKWYNL